MSLYTENERAERSIFMGKAVSHDRAVNLKRYLLSVERGSDQVLVTPWLPKPAQVGFDQTKGEFRKIMDGWREILMHHFEVKHFNLPGLLDYELEQYEKAGPTSTIDPLDMMTPKLMEYYELIKKPSTPIIPEAIAATYNKFSNASFQIQSFEETIKNMVLSTNSGLPFFTSKSSALSEMKRMSWNLEVASGIIANQYPYSEVAVLGHRTQSGGWDPEDSKQRIIFMFPMLVNIEELCVYQPLIAASQRFGIVPGWHGPSFVDRHITKLFDSANGDLVICTDFSGFDQHFNKDLQDCAGELITHLGYSAKMRDWMKFVFRKKYTIPVLDQWGHVYTGLHGMGSGSGGTNADETLAHSALQYECAIKHNAKLNQYSTCLGDDGILTYPGIKVEHVVDVYESHGQECNYTKQYASTKEAIYLRRYYNVAYRDANRNMLGVYPTMRALGKLCYIERFHEDWTATDWCLRALSIIENCSNHPLFEEFVDYCITKDKFRLGLDIPQVVNIITYSDLDVSDKVRSTMSYLQKQERKPIKDWNVSKYLRSKLM